MAAIFHGRHRDGVLDRRDLHDGPFSMKVLGSVVVYGDKLGKVKVVSTLPCIRGFSSYLYEIYVKVQKDKKKEKEKEQEREREGL